MKEIKTAENEENEELQFWKTKFMEKYNKVFNRLGRSKNHKVVTLFKSPLAPIQGKGRRVPIHIQPKVGAEIKKLIREGHIVKLDKCTSDQFCSTSSSPAKKDGTVKLAMDAKPMNAQIYKNKFQMPKAELLDSAAQIITSKDPGEVWFTSLDLKYAFSQLALNDSVSKHCNFNIVCGEFTGTYRFKAGFYGLTDMPKEFQKAKENTLQGLSGVFCFLDDILSVSKSSILDYNKTVENVLQRLDNEGFALKGSKCKFSKKSLTYLGFEIDSEGKRPKHSKIASVLNLTPP